MEAHGLDPRVVQCHVTFNPRAGTLRGMHWQTAPAIETKVVRCTRGAIHDVVVDLRPGSPTYGRHVGVELSAGTGRALYVPGLFAHGYQTLTDDTEVSYVVSERYSPAHESGFRHDDPAFGIEWPLPVTVISDKDRAWAPFGVAEAVPT
jgi:dTDP-4-dehydrorhamnose 3,5-epimerase